jgi:hypothetical protein
LNERGGVRAALTGPVRIVAASAIVAHTPSSP